MEKKKNIHDLVSFDFCDVLTFLCLDIRCIPYEFYGAMSLFRYK